MYVWMKTILSLRLKFYVENFLSYPNMWKGEDLYATEIVIYMIRIIIYLIY